jgi:hypothetical protein
MHPSFNLIEITSKNIYFIRLVNFYQGGTMKKFNYSTVMMVALMLFLALTTGCSGPKDDEKQVNDDAATMVRTYINHIDNGEYTAAIKILQLDSSTNWEDQYMAGIVEVGGTRGEKIEIKDINISCNRTPQAVVEGRRIYLGQCSLSCSIYIDGQLNHPWSSKDYKFRYTNENGVGYLRNDNIGIKPIFNVILEEKVQRDFDRVKAQMNR